MSVPEPLVYVADASAAPVSNTSVEVAVSFTETASENLTLISISSPVVYVSSVLELVTDNTVGIVVSAVTVAFVENDFIAPPLAFLICAAADAFCE